MTEAKRTSKKSVAKPATETRAKAVPAKTSAPAKTRPATKPVPAKPPAAKPAAKAKPETAAKARRPRATKPASVAPEQRRNYIEVAAYYIAERRAFAPGDPLQDWIQAEAEVDRLLGEGLLGGLEG